jgi:uncharacterized protein YyaL (SSP411 family)
MVRWLPWGGDAFARAAREGKPVLLSITAAWCRACHEMDRTTYADPAVAALIHERFVPVRVDTDRRPDINERYNLGGWPTTAFLTARGALITGGTFVPVERMPGVLRQVAEAMQAIGDAREAEGERQAEGERIGESGERTADGALIESIFATFDGEYGGFGVEPKFPHTAALHLAMGLFHETGDDRWRLIVRRTLDAMAAGGLWDAASGGFYRYATTRDWQLPHQEKLLETNAALLRVYAEAAAEWNDPADVARTRAVARFITTALRAPAGGYHGSDAEGGIDVDCNAAAAGALLRAAEVLDDSDLAREALTSFERVLLLCYKPGAGVAHYYDGQPRVRGLLADHVAAIGALLHAHEASGLEPYRMMAEELAYLVVRDLRDERDGGFLDRAAAPDDVGLLRARRQPFLANADAALAFGRLATLEPRKGFPDPAAFRVHAEGALAAAARQLNGQGPLAAHYALARRLLID